MIGIGATFLDGSASEGDIARSALWKAVADSNCVEHS
jgi:hypothetical protein